MISKRVLIVLLVVAGNPPSAAPEGVARPEIFGGAGTHLADGGWNAGVGVGLRVRPPFALFAELHHGSIPFESFEWTLQPPFTLVRKRTQEGATSMLGGMQLSAFPRSLVSPYILATFGHIWFHSSGGTRAEGSTLHVGVGVRLRLSANLSLFGEGRNAFLSGPESTGLGWQLPLKVGLVWRLR